LPERTRVRVGTLGDLVDVALGGQPGADVDELVDARVGEVGDRPLRKPRFGSILG
jgi:hypothetical protein